MRSKFIISISLLQLWSCIPAIAADAYPVSGFSLPELKQLDKDIVAELRKWSIPGATICIARNGKIIASRGYGLADKEKKIPVQPDFQFRIGSLSKSLTAIATLNLCGMGALTIDTKPFTLLKIRPSIHPNIRPDPDLKTMTVKNLLQCTSGWDDSCGSAVFGRDAQSAAEHSLSLRPTPLALVSYAICQPLSFHPGDRFAYANLNYVVLELLLENISKQKYSDFVTNSVLKPFGMNQTVPGQTVKPAPKEVRYYATEGSGKSLLPNERRDVSSSYGADYYLEGITASAGWVSSAPDLVKLGLALLSPKKRQSVLSQRFFDAMLARPDYESTLSENEYFAMGWEAKRRRSGQLVEFSRHGSLSGSMALISCRSDGIVWAALFNSRPLSYEPSREEIKATINRNLGALLTGNKTATNAAGGQD